MRNKIIMGVLGLSILLMSGCTSTKTEEINVLATTDLHGEIPYDLSSYVKNEYKKDENITNLTTELFNKLPKYHFLLSAPVRHSILRLR